MLQAKNDGEIIGYNMAAREIFGQELRGKLLTDLFDGLNLYDIKIIANYGVSQVEQKIDTDTFLFTLRSDLDENTLYAFGSNISDRILAENELRSAHRQNELLLASITSILISVDRNGYIQQWNQVAESTFGIPTAETIGRKFAKCGIQWSKETVQDKINECIESQKPVWLDQIRFTRKDGNEGFLSINISPIKSKKGNSGGFLLLGNDVTERKVLEAQLSQAQKLEAIGQLGAGIAHEINTPMQYIGDNDWGEGDGGEDMVVVIFAIHAEETRTGRECEKPVLKDFAKEWNIKVNLTGIKNE